MTFLNCIIISGALISACGSGFVDIGYETGIDNYENETSLMTPSEEAKVFSHAAIGEGKPRPSSQRTGYWFVGKGIVIRHSGKIRMKTEQFSGSGKHQEQMENA